MAFTNINGEDRLVQAAFAAHLQKVLGWENVYAWNDETFGPDSTLGRTDPREVVLTRDLRTAIVKLNPDLPTEAVQQAVSALTRTDLTRSLLQHNQVFHGYIRDGVPVSYRDASGQRREAHARVIDFSNGRQANGTANNRFVAVGTVRAR